MRLLLDEGFPAPLGFDIGTVDSTVAIVALRDFDPALIGVSTPDWYLYLRADEAGFDALVTRDKNQLRQEEELWAITNTNLSLITWRRSTEDPIREWGQLLAYLPEIQRLLKEHGPSLVLLPTPRLTKRNLEKASGTLNTLAKERKLSAKQLSDEAHQTVLEELNRRGEPQRFPLLQRR